MTPTPTPDMLQKLRRTVLMHAVNGLTDLPAMAADLRGCFAAYQQADQPRGLEQLLARSHGPSQWLLGEHRQPRLGMMLMVWPAHGQGSWHTQGRCWSLEMVLQGALRIEHPAADSEWMGVGDTRLIQPANGLLLSRHHNLSRSEMAVSLHVFGCTPAAYLASLQDGEVTAQSAAPADPKPPRAEAMVVAGLG